jgi:UDP-N-acetyl-D-mannosaminuronic acid dehydrogenase
VRDDRLVPLEHVLAQAEILVIGAPHSEYKELSFTQPVVDPWNLMGGGVLV